MIVYSLTDPNDNVLRYIGISKHTANQRFAIHLKDAKTAKKKGIYLSKKEKWLIDLDNNNQRPIIQTLYNNLTEDEAAQLEIELISKYKRICEGGTLYNVQLGGDYNSCKATPWNKDLHNCYTEEFLKNNQLSQPNKKEVYRFDKNGAFLDKWISIRDMCKQLSLDRRSVMRCLKKEDNFKSHKGFMFSHTSEPPVYINNSTLHTYHNHSCAKPIVAIKDNQSLYFKSIREAGEKLGIKTANITAILRGAYHKTQGYTFKYQ